LNQHILLEKAMNRPIQKDLEKAAFFFRNKKMRPPILKWTFVALGIVTIVSMSLNWVLLERLQSAGGRVNQWKLLYEQLSEKYRQLEAWQIEHRSPVDRQDPAVAKAKPTPSATDKTAGPIYNPSPATGYSENKIYPLLAFAIENDFPELELSNEELMQLSEVVLTIREALQNLRETERSTENFADFRQLEDRRDQALWDFKRITGMSFEAFMRRTPSEGGLDNHAPVEDEITFEYLRDFRP
jgi:hypothetical protein